MGETKKKALNFALFQHEYEHENDGGAGERKSTRFRDISLQKLTFT